jgi:hypothetical protein
VTSGDGLLTVDRIGYRSGMDGIEAYSTESAREAAERDELAGWIHDFLASPGSDNAALADQLTAQERWWLGPVRLPHDQLHRLAGPPGAPVLEVFDEDDWRDDVEELADLVEEDGVEPPPVIVTLRGSQLVLEDGNHRVEALRRAGEDEVWAIVGFEDPESRDRFAREHR